MSITIFLRLLKKNVLLGISTAGGLALGFCAALLCLALIHHEFAFDRNFPSARQIFRLDTITYPPGQPQQSFAASPGPLRAAMREVGAPVDALARALQRHSLLRTAEYRGALNVLYVDGEFARIFVFPTLEGDVAQTLRSPVGLVVPVSISRKLFPGSPAIGKEVRIGDTAYQIGAIVADLPETTHFDFDAIAPVASLPQEERAGLDEQWGSLGAALYGRLPASAQGTTQVLQSANDAYARFAPSEFRRGGPGEKPLFVPVVVPLLDLHFRGGYFGSFKPGGSESYVFSFAAIAVVVLVVAAINFTNLLVAQTERRKREFAIRRAIGATSYRLIGGIGLESLMWSGLALTIGVAMAIAVVPLLRHVLEYEFDVATLLSFTVIGGGLLVCLATAALVAIYPSAAAIRLDVAKILSGREAIGHRAAVLVRRSLVALQFMSAVALSTAAVAIVLQARHITRLGDVVRAHDLVSVTTPLPSSDPRIRSLRDALLRQPVVTDLTMSSDIPGRGERQDIRTVAPRPPAAQISMEFQSVSPSFFRVYGIRPIAGRTFDPSLDGRETDEMIPRVVLSQSAVKALGFGNPQSAIDAPLMVEATDHRGVKVDIVGVVADFDRVYAELAPIPTIYVLDPALLSAFTLRVPEASASSISRITALAQEYAVDYPVDVTSLGQEFKERYKGVSRLGSGFTAGALVALAIASMGMFALAAFTARRKRKEIALRQVFGASQRDILLMLVWEFMTPAAIGAAIGLAAAAAAIRIYMSQFTSHAELSLWPYAIGVLLGTASGIFGITQQLVTSSRRPPAEALRT